MPRGATRLQGLAAGNSVADRVDHHRRACAVEGRAHALCGIAARRIDRCVGAQAASNLQAISRAVQHDDAAGAGGAVRLQRHQAQCAGADHHHVLIRRRGQVRHVHAVGQRLDHGGLRVTHLLRQRVYQVLRSGDALREGSLEVPAHQASIRTGVGVTREAQRTVPAAHQWLHRHAVADGEARHAGTKLHDLSSEFMAHHHWWDADLGVPEEPVQVRAAQPCRVDLHQYLAVCGPRLRPLLHLHRPRRRVDKRLHPFPSPKS